MLDKSIDFLCPGGRPIGAFQRKDEHDKIIANEKLLKTNVLRHLRSGKYGFCRSDVFNTIENVGYLKISINISKDQ